MRLTETQLLALRAVEDGALDYANPRTVHSLLAKGLIVYTGSGGGGPQEYAITDKGTKVLDEEWTRRGCSYGEPRP